MVGKRRYLSRTPLTSIDPAQFCSSNPKARADHAFEEQHRPKEYSVAVEFKPRANCGGFTWLGSAVFGVSMCITQAGKKSNSLTRNTFDVSTHVITISLFEHLSRFSPSSCRATDWIASWQMCSKLGSGPRMSQAYSIIGWPIIWQSLALLPEISDGLGWCFNALPLQVPRFMTAQVQAKASTGTTSATCCKGNARRLWFSPWNSTQNRAKI